MIIKNVNPTKLADELVARNVYPTITSDLQPGEDIAQNVEVVFSKDVDLKLVQQIIDAHVPTPNPQPLSDIEKLRLEQAQANSELIQLILMMGGA